MIRHTRGDEEEGRTELLRAGVVGRRAPLVAALILTLGASLLLGLLTALALVAAGLDARGAWAFGLSWPRRRAFAAVAPSPPSSLPAPARPGASRSARSPCRSCCARSATSVAGGPLVAVLALTDRVEPAGPPFGGNRWWVALVPVVFTALAVALAVVLLDRRDLGSGLVQSRPGPSRAGPGLRTPLGLAWRLHRASFLAWLSGFVVLALVLGNMASDLGGLLDSPGARDLITRMGGVQGLTDAFLSTESVPAAWSPRHTACRRCCGCAGRSRRCAPSRCWPRA